MIQEIQIRGARTHNLKNIDLHIPRNKLVVITGLSGSGKSSLAFDTLYAEGQRRYVESLSAYARQFLSMMAKPDVDSIEGLSPAISIEQKSTSHNPRSTVGTVTEIYDYLRLLYARIGDPRCPEHGVSLAAQTVTEMVDQVMELPEGSRIQLLAPVVRNRKGEHTHLLQKLRTEGFIRIRLDGVTVDLDDIPEIEKNKNHSIEVVVDRFKIRPDIQQRVAESFETALLLTDGLAIVASMDDSEEAEDSERLFSARFACPICDYSLNELEPRLFSFNNPAGACTSCDGLGMRQFFDAEKIIQFPEVSLDQGAIRGWDKRNIYYYQMLVSLAQHYKFSLDTAFDQLSEQQQDIVLNGSGTESIEFTYINDRGDTYIRKHPFEGIVPNFERRYHDTESNAVREDLAKYLTIRECESCEGSRLRTESRNVFIDDRPLHKITAMTVAESLSYYEKLELQGAQAEIGDKILKEIHDRLRFLADVGLGYLNLNRSADTLSGGEAQRIRLASQIGAGLVGVMYVLDEPSIGLHQRDNERLLATLTRLRDIGNTVIVVEHDEEAIRAADQVIDIGPGAGVHGGAVIAQGVASEIADCEDSLTGDYLSGRKKIATPANRTPTPKDEWLCITGARGNNLQSVDLKIPKGLFTCITGVSGSGKSTLINETLYPLAATKLNKATTLSASAHDEIEGLDMFTNCVDIDQSPIGRTPRSNPATYTGLFTQIRDLFAGTEEARSRGLGMRQFFDAEKIIQFPEVSLDQGAIRGWDKRNIYYYQMLVSLAQHYKFSLDTAFDQLSEQQQDIVLNGSGTESIEFTYINDRGDTYIRKHPFEGIVPNFERRYHDTESNAVREDLAKYLTIRECESCEGSRLRTESRNVFIDDRPLHKITAMTVAESLSYYEKLELQGAQAEIGDKILKEIHDRLRFLADVGLGYLNLNRSADTLSGGEAQRIRLASQIGAGLVGVMYVLDEPSIGLHQRDNERLLATLTRLRDIGNTVIVVEHDEEAIRAADQVIDIGPGAGVHGGAVIAQGVASEIADCEDSLTGDYLSGRKKIATPANRTPTPKDEWLCITGARGNNLQSVDLKIPKGLFTCITGVSGSGKSTLINETLYPLAATKLNKATTLSASAHDEIEGLDMFTNCVDIDQSPIGRTPRSNPATYTGLFTQIRDLFAGTEEARSRGYKPGRFSFNVKGGRCEACQGDGVIKVEMHFLPDVYVVCETCDAKRYNRETLEVKYKGKSIAEVLDMTVEDALDFFDAIPAIKRRLETLMSVGLSYIRLGQNATTLSGGEAQRVKLSKELAKMSTGSTLYILDEPTTGLHFHDIKQLLDVLHRLRDEGNTMIVIEHNLDVIKTADWVIDLGPEGGSGGGKIIAQGTPEDVAKSTHSYTGRFLGEVL